MPRKRPPEEYAKVTVSGRAVSVVDSLGRVNLDDLATEIEETGAEAVWWGVLTARAKRAEGDAELMLKVTRARLGRQERMAAVDRGEGKLSNDAVEERVLLTPEYQHAHRAWLDAQEQASVVESAKYAIVQKNKVLEGMVGDVMRERNADRPSLRLPPFLQQPRPAEPAVRQPYRPRS